MAQPKAPVIIIGMHRSGTSMLTKLLKDLGLFIGHKLLPDNLYEASYFVMMNEWIMRQSNTTWDNTYNYQFVDERLNEEVKSIVLKEFRNKKRKEFLGKLKYGDIKKIDIPWGWKDPRSTITIDLWKSIFPDAKILHIYRNPIDVAASLSRREIDLRKSKKITYIVKILRFLDYKATQNLSMRVTHLEEGVKLWEEYVSKAMALEDKYGDNLLHIKYEDFLENPSALLPQILNFCALDPQHPKIPKLIKDINADRKYAFIHKPELVEVYSKVKDRPLVQKMGYSEIV